MEAAESQTGEGTITERAFVREEGRSSGLELTGPCARLSREGNKSEIHLNLNGIGDGIPYYDEELKKAFQEIFKQVSRLIKRTEL